MLGHSTYGSLAYGVLVASWYWSTYVAIRISFGYSSLNNIIRLREMSSNLSHLDIVHARRPRTGWRTWQSGTWRNTTRNLSGVGDPRARPRKCSERRVLGIYWRETWTTKVSWWRSHTSGQHPQVPLWLTRQNDKALIWSWDSQLSFRDKNVFGQGGEQRQILIYDNDLPGYSRNLNPSYRDWFLNPGSTVLIYPEDLKSRHELLFVLHFNKVLYCLKVRNGLRQRGTLRIRASSREFNLAERFRQVHDAG